MNTVRRGGFLLAKVHQAAGRVFARMLTARGVDITPAQGRVLFVLWQHGPQTPGELARQVSLQKSTLTAAIDRLEAAGQVTRVRSAEDRRSIVIQLTERSAETRRWYNEISQEMSERFYLGFTDEQATRFEKDLEQILHNLESED